MPGGADLHERAWDMAKGFDGRYYGVPTSAQANVLFVRKDWREKLKPAAAARPGPTCRSPGPGLHHPQDPDGNGKADTYGFAMPGSAQRGYTAWFMSSSYVWQGGRRLLAGSHQPWASFKPTANEAGTVAQAVGFRAQACIAS